MPESHAWIPCLNRMPESQDITLYLAAARGGDRAALDEVFRRVYGEIHRLARAQVRRCGPQPTLSASVIVHEAYLKLARAPAVAWEDRAHFFSVAARAMRQVLLNHARRHLAAKRGGGRPLPLDTLDHPIDPRAAELVDLDVALGRLAALDPRLEQVVELRFFGGLSEEETAEVLGVHERTVRRDWRAARAFLHRELAGVEPA